MSLTTSNLTEEIKNRFWIKVNRKSPTECWLWLGANNGRYGTMTIFRKTNGAHKVSYIIHKGDVPEGLFVLHNCDNTWCVNPDHLYLGTHARNMQDKAERGTYRGDRINTSKLTEPAVRLIKRAYSDGHYNQVELAKIVGVTQAAISDIVLGNNWKHIN